MLLYIILLFQSALICWIVKEYIKAKQFIRNILKMTSIDSILDEMLDAPEPQKSTKNPNPNEESMQDFPRGGNLTFANANAKLENHRERLIALVVGGKAKVYLGKEVSVDTIDSMSNEEIAKLYARYESRLGATMTKTLGQAILQLYARAAGHVLPIPPASQNLLYTDLENDPFVGHALTSVTCELYHKYGMYLAPITTALTTARYCEFKQKDLVNNNGERESNCDGRDSTENEES